MWGDGGGQRGPEELWPCVAKWSDIQSRNSTLLSRPFDGKQPSWLKSVLQQLWRCTRSVILCHSKDSVQKPDGLPFKRRGVGCGGKGECLDFVQKKNKQTKKQSDISGINNLIPYSHRTSSQGQRHFAFSPSLKVVLGQHCVTVSEGTTDYSLTLAQKSPWVYEQTWI